MIKNIDYKNFKEKLKFDLEKENIPEIIYKYMPINENTFRNLLNNQIWFSSPLKFNDPFDCRMFKLKKPTVEELENYFRFLKNSEEKIKRIIKDYNKSPQKLLQYAQEKVKELINKMYFISCFSYTKKNILMWSHYSDKHQGICLAFNTFKLFPTSSYRDNEIHKVLRVKNVPDYPIINRFNLDEFKVDVFKIFKNKSDIWNEEEIRFIAENKNPDKDKTPVIFNKEALLEINFGCKTDENDQRDIIKLIKKCTYPNVKLWRAKENIDKFGLLFNEIEV